MQLVYRDDMIVLVVPAPKTLVMEE